MRARIVSGAVDGGPAVSVHLFYDIVPTFQISVFGTQGWRLIEMKNYFEMFRHNIEEFVRSVREGRPRLEFAKTENIIRTLIAANESLRRGGEQRQVIARRGAADQANWRRHVQLSEDEKKSCDIVQLPELAAQTSRLTRAYRARANTRLKA